MVEIFWLGEQHLLQRNIGDCLITRARYAPGLVAIRN